jgi:hypothetical protein
MKKNINLILLLALVVACEGVIFETDLSDKSLQLISPVNNATLNNAQVSFYWDNVEDAINYKIQIATPAFSNASEVVLDTLISETSFDINLESNEYEWRVRAENNNTKTAFTTAHFTLEPEIFTYDISNDTIILLAPANGVIVQNDTLSFSWEAIPFAENYTLQVATPNFDNANQILVDEILTETTSQQILPDGTYQWRVKAKNSTSETNFTTFNFEVSTSENFQDQEVLVIAPPNEYVSKYSDVTLQWLEISNATLYRIQILNSDTNDLIQEITTNQTQLVVSFPEGNFIWQVRAETNTENTGYTQQTITIDSIAPNTAILVSPTDLSILTNTQVTFTWTREPVLGTTEFDSLYVFRDSSLSLLALKEEVSGGSETQTLDNNQTYFWFIKSFDQAGNQSNDSTIFSFTINQ